MSIISQFIVVCDRCKTDIKVEGAKHVAYDYHPQIRFNEKPLTNPDVLHVCPKCFASFLHWLKNL